jgi:hypothetical protein
MLLHAVGSLLLTLVPSAHAGGCDAQLNKIGNLPPDGAASAFTDLAKCDPKVAEANFNRYLEKATDADAAGAVLSAAIEAEVWHPAWGALSKITSYEARDEVAQNIGASCADHPKVVSFLQGAYLGLRDVEFQQWDDAFAACTAEPLWTWVAKQVESPPAKQFDEKFTELMAIYVKHAHSAALPSLTTGALAAAKNNGPFDAIVAKMVESVTPDLGATVSPEDEAKLEEAMVNVANSASVDQAKSVAGQLANAGADAAAAKLLPKIFADRKQGNGTFLYGGAAIEAGDCGGKKNAIIHYAQVTDPGKRWSIAKDLEAPLRAVKPKLGKDCKVDGAWPVISSPEPVKAAGDIDAWVDSLEAQWTKDGYAVKTQKEKPVALN